jgi:hypothetical protein
LLRRRRDAYGEYRQDEREASHRIMLSRIPGLSVSGESLSCRPLSVQVGRPWALVSPPSLQYLRSIDVGRGHRLIRLRRSGWRASSPEYRS